MGRLAVLMAALAVLVGCGGGGTVADCWEDAVNRPSAVGGCQGIDDPGVLDACLVMWDDVCQEQTGD